MISTLLAIALFPSLAAAPLASPAEFVSSADAEGILWEPQPVRPGVSRAQVHATPPYVKGTGADVRGAISVNAEQGAAFFLRPLEVVRVTTADSKAALRFTRVPVSTRADASTLRLEERGVLAKPGQRYLAEPMGEGSVWIITAQQGAADVSVERPHATQSTEALRAALLACIDGARDCPSLPQFPTVSAELEVSRELAAAFTQADPALQQAALDLHKAATLRALNLVEQLTPSTFALQYATLPGTAEQLTGDAPYFRQTQSNGAHLVVLEGPGVLSISARGLAGAKSPTVLTLRDESKRIVARTALPVSASFGVDNDSTALPEDREPLRTSAGEVVAIEDELRVVLQPGQNRFNLEWAGGTVLLRPRWALRRPFLIEVLDGTADFHALAERGLNRLQGMKGPNAALLRHELAALLGRNEPISAEAPSSETLKALAAVIRLETSQKNEVDLAGLPKTSALAWRFRLRAATASPSNAAALLIAPKAVPENAGLLLDFADTLSWAAREGNELQALSALELSWRYAPLSLDVRRRYRAAFSELTRWTNLRGHAKTEFDSSQWLDVETPDPGDAPSPQALTLLSAGEKKRFVNAEGGTLRLYALQGAAAKPLTLTVAGGRYDLNALSVVERVELALPAGSVEVALEGDGRVFLALPNGEAQTPKEHAFLRVAYPVDSKRRVEFVRPSDNSPLPLRISLRSAHASRKPIDVTLRTDTGLAQQLTLEPSTVSSRQLRLDAKSAQSSAIANAVVTVPPLTRELWFESDEDVYAAISVRGVSTVALDAPLPALTAATEKDVPHLLELSRLIRTANTPRPVLLLERAELLLRFGEPLLARADLTSLAERDDELSREQSAKLRQLVDRLASTTSIAATNEAAKKLSRPVLLSPGYPTVPADDTTAAIAARARTEGADAALAQLSTATTPSERWLKARLLRATGHADEALTELLTLQHEAASPWVAKDAIEAFANVPVGSEVFMKAAPFVLPLPEQIDAPLPFMGRAVVLADRATRWEPLANAEQSGGDAVVKAEPPPSLRTAVRRALVAPEFNPEESHFIRAGDSSVLQTVTTKGQQLVADFDCGTPPVAARSADCIVAVRVDGKLLETRTVKAATSTSFTFPALSAGRHELELNVSEGGVGLARYSTTKNGETVALQTAKPKSFQRALPGRPVTFTVLGPAVLRVSNAADNALTATITQPSGTARTETISTQNTDDGRYLVLTESGPHRVTFATTGSEALVRAELGVGEREVEPLKEVRLTLAELSAESTPLAMPAAPPPLALLPGDSDPFANTANGFGTLSGELAIAQEVVPEDQRPDRALRTGLEARLSYRRELLDRKAFLRFAPTVRVPYSSTPVTGGALTLYSRSLPLGLRAQLSGSALTQQLSSSWHSSFTGHAAVDRPFELTPDLRFTPAVGFTMIGFNNIDAAAEAQLDRSVYTDYARDHSRRLLPGAALRWKPLQDQVGQLGVRAMTNADLTTLDHWTSAARWTSLLGGPLHLMRVGLGYELSHRLADADRSQTYFRHAVELSLDRTMWTAGQGRLLMFAQNRLEVSSPFGPQNLFSLGVRWDWTGGRGLSDLMPSEEEFDEPLSAARFAN